MKLCGIIVLGPVNVRFDLEDCPGISGTGLGHMFGRAFCILAEGVVRRAIDSPQRALAVASLEIEVLRREAVDLSVLFLSKMS